MTRSRPGSRPRLSRDVASTCTPGQPSARAWASRAGIVDDMLAVVQHQQQLAGAQGGDDGLVSGAGVSLMPRGPRRPWHAVPAQQFSARSISQAPSSTHPARRREGQPGLADPAGPDQGHHRARGQRVPRASRSVAPESRPSRRGRFPWLPWPRRGGGGAGATALVLAEDQRLHFTQPRTGSTPSCSASCCRAVR